MVEKLNSVPQFSSRHDYLESNYFDDGDWDNYDDDEPKIDDENLLPSSRKGKDQGSTKIGAESNENVSQTVATKEKHSQGGITGHIESPKQLAQDALDLDKKKSIEIDDDDFDYEDDGFVLGDDSEDNAAAQKKDPPK